MIYGWGSAYLCYTILEVWLAQIKKGPLSDTERKKETRKYLSENKVENNLEASDVACATGECEV